jgi:hypothetical protein
LSIYFVVSSNITLSSTFQTIRRNSVVNIDDIIADERLQKLFHQLNLTEDNQKKLSKAFQHYFMRSTSTDMYLKKVKQELIKLSTSINQDDLKNIVEKISELLEEHSHVFSETLNCVRILEDNTDFLYNPVSKVQEESNMEEAFILANDLSTLYEEYFVKPVFLQRFGDDSWNKFTNRLSELEQETNKNILKSIQGRSSVTYEDLYAPLIQYLEPLQKEIVHIPRSINPMSDPTGNRSDFMQYNGIPKDSMTRNHIGFRWIGSDRIGSHSWIDSRIRQPGK